MIKAMDLTTMPDRTRNRLADAPLTYSEVSATVSHQQGFPSPALTSVAAT